MLRLEAFAYFERKTNAPRSEVLPECIAARLPICMRMPRCPGRSSSLGKETGSNCPRVSIITTTTIITITIIIAQILIPHGFARVRHPRRLFHAFVGGRRARNLYGTSDDDALLSRSLGEVREALGIGTPVSAPTPADRRAFVRGSARALGASWGPRVTILVLGWWTWC